MTSTFQKLNAFGIIHDACSFFASFKNTDARTYMDTFFLRINVYFECDESYQKYDIIQILAGFQKARI